MSNERTLTSEKQLYHCASCNQDYDFDTQGAVCPHRNRDDGGIDRLAPWPKPVSEPMVTISVALLREIADTMGHAHIFIRTREKMHPTGVQLYEVLQVKIQEALT